MDQTHLKKIRTSLLVPQQGTISPARLENVLNVMLHEAIRLGANLKPEDAESAAVRDVVVDTCLEMGAEAANSYTPARNLPV